MLLTRDPTGFSGSLTVFLGHPADWFYSVYGLGLASFWEGGNSLNMTDVRFPAAYQGAVVASTVITDRGTYEESSLLKMWLKISKVSGKITF